MRNLIVFLSIALFVSACGWHLRGAVDESGQSLYNAPLDLRVSSTDEHGPLMNSLRQQFHSYNVHEVKRKTEGAYRLKLGELKLDKRAAGAGADALVNVYELLLSVDYQVSSPDGVLTAPDTRASISRTYNFEISTANTSEQEEALILREMHRELAQQILRRLKVLHNQEQTRLQQTSSAASSQPQAAQ